MKKAAGLLLGLALTISLPARSAPEGDFSAWVNSMLARVVQATQERVEQGEKVPVAVAGLRGAEQKKKDLEPYWKGELTARSADYQAYREIERRMQEGRYADTLKLVATFKQKYPQSKLTPEVHFTLGLAYAGLGKNREAVATFEELLKLYPDHQLVEASKEGIVRLKKA